MSNDGAAQRHISGEGTPNAAWLAWPGLAALPAVTVKELVPHGARAVIVAPHPDDEVLGCGGLLQLLRAQGSEILLVAVTDGGGSHGASTLWPPERLERVRPQETAQALAALGVPALPTIRAGFPDGGVADCVTQLRVLLECTLQPGDVVFTTWRKDGHPDHEATGTAAAAAAKTSGATLIELPVWTWHWATPGDSRVPWERAVRLPLPAHILQRKRSAVACYASQLARDPSTGQAPILPQYVLDRLFHPYEVYFR